MVSRHPFDIGRPGGLRGSAASATAPRWGRLRRAAARFAARCFACAPSTCVLRTRVPSEMVYRALIGVCLGVLLAWAALVLFLFLARPKGSLVKEAIRLLPDTLRLLRRLATDRELPRSVRVRLWLLFAYLALPIDLIPDFIPLIGYADDAIIVCI